MEQMDEKDKIIAHQHFVIAMNAVAVRKAMNTIVHQRILALIFALMVIAPNVIDLIGLPPVWSIVSLLILLSLSVITIFGQRREDQRCNEEMSCIIAGYMEFCKEQGIDPTE